LAVAEVAVTQDLQNQEQPAAVVAVQDIVAQAEQELAAKVMLAQALQTEQFAVQAVEQEVLLVQGLAPKVIFLAEAMKAA
jgi:hypothetical protein